MKWVTGKMLDTHGVLRLSSLHLCRVDSHCKHFQLIQVLLEVPFFYRGCLTRGGNGPHWTVQTFPVETFFDTGVVSEWSILDGNIHVIQMSRAHKTF